MSARQTPAAREPLLDVADGPAVASDNQRLGMFTGSGAIEGAIKAIVVQRAKLAGMHWTVEGAEDIIHLRCQRASGRWDEMWPARPDPLLLAV